MGLGKKKKDEAEGCWEDGGRLLMGMEDEAVRVDDKYGGNGAKLNRGGLESPKPEYAVVKGADRK